MEYNVTAFGAESGGMNELGYNLYDVTGDKRYLELAGMYEHPEFQQVRASRSAFDNSIQSLLQQGGVQCSGGNNVTESRFLYAGNLAAVAWYSFHNAFFAV